MEWGGRKDSVPLRVYDLTERLFNAGDMLEISFGKRTNQLQDREQKSQGEEQRLFSNGINQGQFSGLQVFEVRFEKEEKKFGGETQVEKSMKKNE